MHVYPVQRGGELTLNMALVQTEDWETTLTAPAEDHAADLDVQESIECPGTMNLTLDAWVESLCTGRGR
eukprot:SAG31_NODE_247_length_19134_cov_12.255050_1_plen_69_part_00